MDLFVNVKGRKNEDVEGSFY